jgi:hypothetical protein
MHLHSIHARLNPPKSQKDVLGCVVNLCIEGSTQTKRISNPILLEAAPTKSTTQTKRISNNAILLKALLQQRPYHNFSSMLDGRIAEQNKAGQQASRE